jgi:hypothetical protein
MIAFLALIIAIAALGLAVIALVSDAFRVRVCAGPPGPPGPTGLTGPEEIDAAIKRLAIAAVVKGFEAQSVSRKRFPYGGS